MTARQVFRDVFGDEPNFMTPNLVKLETIGDYIVEVSEGSGLEPGTRLYGVTVLELDGTRTDLSRSFPNPEAVAGYLETLV